MRCAALLTLIFVPAALAADKPGAAAPSRPPVSVLTAQFDTLLAHGRIQTAVRQVPVLQAAYERTFAADTLQLVDALNKLAAKLAGAGPEAAGPVEGLFLRGLHLREARFGPEDVSVAKSCNNLANVFINRGEYERAAAYKERDLAVRLHALGARHPQVARTQHEFAVLQMQLGRYRDAGTHFAAALAAVDVQPSPDSTRLANLLGDVSELRRIETRYAAAESCLQRSLALGAHLFPPDDPWFAVPTNNLAGLYRDLGRYSDAEPLLDRSLRLRADATRPDSTALATANLNLAELYRLQNRSQEAAARYAEALRLARRARGKDDPALVWFLIQNAVYGAEQGAPQRAESLYREALAVLDRAGGPASLAAQTANDLADLMAKQAHFAAAESLYQQALATREELLGPSHPDVALTLTGLARCLHASGAGHDAPALQLLKRACDILDATHAEPEARIEAHATRAFLLADRGDLRAAVGSMAIALDQVEVLRPKRGAAEASRVRFLAGHSHDADAMVRWCLSLGETGRAIEVVERLRARAFLDRVAGAEMDVLADVPAAERTALEAQVAAAHTQLGELQRRLARLLENQAQKGDERRRQIAQIEIERDTAARDLERAQESLLGASPAWRARLAESSAQIHVAGIAARAPAQGCIVLFRIGAETSYAFAIPPPPQQPQAWELAIPPDVARSWGVAPGPLTAAALETAVAGSGAFGSGNPTALASRLMRVRGIGRLADVGAKNGVAPPERLGQSLYDLWRVLIPAPLWDQLVRAPETILVPDGALCQLPFEALVVAAKDASTAPRYWLDDGPVIRYALSGASLIAPGNGTAERAPDVSGGNAAAPVPLPEVLSVSAPAFAPNGPFAALPATARETAVLRAALGRMPMTILQGKDATEPNVRRALPGKRYLHLATHGIVDPKRDQSLAGIVLTPPAQPTRETAADGWLQLFEIYDLRLDCDLAVLSACETGVGTYVAGEGVYALSRGFLAAGAQQVVASLWSVEDESTATLVGGFLGGVIASGRHPDASETARALRDAKRRIRSRKEWSAPFFWAPFILTSRH